jgi:hypothetical protein
MQYKIRVKATRGQSVIEGETEVEAFSPEEAEQKAITETTDQLTSLHLEADDIEVVSTEEIAVS